ncbi:MAG: hypothetical protein AB7Q37_09995 [Pyrinomonadaceae bacterium]
MNRSGRRSGYFVRVFSTALAALMAAASFSGCSVPNLDPPLCSEARTPVREFYSLHFGNEMAVSPDVLALRRQFITDGLFERAAAAEPGTDPFTSGSADLPKAFRVGECRVLGPERTGFDVLLFWKDDVRSEQRTISIEAVRVNGRWLVDKIVQ